MTRRVRGCATVPLICQSLGVPMPVAEYRFSPPRRWRFDWAWPEAKVALEVQGGVFTAGRHTRGAALMKEHEKVNTAAFLGWRLFYCTPRQVADSEVWEWIHLALDNVGRGCGECLHGDGEAVCPECKGE
jgi:hypothetical protein